MKKIIASALSLVILLCSFTALAENNVPTQGVLASVGTDVSLMTEAVYEHMEATHGLATTDFNIQGYASLNAALMDLYAGRIQFLSTAEFCARYIASRNDDLVYNLTPITNYMGFSMMTLEEDAELYKLLNDAIVELKENGTIEALKQEHIVKCYEGSEPAAIELPEFEGAETIAVAVTGDVPPMDYVSADGLPAGFNLALLAEIAKLAKVNVEVVPVEAMARGTALASGTVDAIFWIGGHLCPDESHEFYVYEEVEGAMITERYLESPCAVVVKKP